MDSAQPRYIVDRDPGFWLPEVGEDVKALIYSMVHSDPERRPRLRQVLAHPFIANM